MELNWVLGGISSVIAVLSGCVTYLFKLYYMDTKAALLDCKEQHKAAKIDFDKVLSQEREDCRKELEKRDVVITQCQARIDSLQDSVLHLYKEKRERGEKA